MDDSRSALDPGRTRNFPDNTEFEALLTFTGKPTGSFVRQVVPSPEYMTLGQHISFVRLPDPGGYKPREFSPESGFMTLEYMDLAVPMGEPLTKQFILRHRLEKKNPGAKALLKVTGNSWVASPRNRLSSSPGDFLMT